MIGSAIGTFILDGIVGKAWNDLTTEELEEIIDRVLKYMLKQDREYNKKFQNSIILLKEIFSDENILSVIGEYLVDEKDILDGECIDIIKKKVDKTLIKTEDIKNMLDDFRDGLLLNIYRNDAITKSFMVTRIANMADDQRKFFAQFTENIEIVGENDTEGYADIGALTQFRIFTTKEFKQSHDRFIIIDDTCVYHFGASLKDLGKKWFAFSKFDKEAFKVLDRLK